MSIINKFIPSERIEELKHLQCSIEESHIRITCIGVYNSGKSKLLDCLVDDLELLTFKVSDTRETTENKLVDIGSYTFVDTPGLNANDGDNKTALEAVAVSDLILFVHNVNNGELDHSETSFLDAISKEWENETTDFIDKTIFVLSRTDEMETESDIHLNLSRIKEQIKNYFDKEVTIISVSSNDYIDGIKEDEHMLIEQSNMLILKNTIETSISRMRDNFKETKVERLERMKWQLLRELSRAMEEKSQELIKLEEKEVHVFLELENINKSLSAKYQKLER